MLEVWRNTDLRGKGRAKGEQAFYAVLQSYPLPLTNRYHGNVRLHLTDHVYNVQLRGSLFAGKPEVFNRRSGRADVFFDCLDDPPQTVPVLYWTHRSK